MRRRLHVVGEAKQDVLWTEAAEADPYQLVRALAACYRDAMLAKLSASFESFCTRPGGHGAG